MWTLAAHLWLKQPLVAAALTLAAGALLTGGRPLGGVARAGDGLAAHGAGGDRSRAFAVMRDPRRGTTGLIALGIALLVKLAFLAARCRPRRGAAWSWPARSGDGRARSP